MYRPCPEFLEYIHKLLDIKGNTDWRELSDRSYEVCESASMYNLTGDEDNELYAEVVVIDSVHPAMRDYIEVEALKCWVDLRII